MYIYVNPPIFAAGRVCVGGGWGGNPGMWVGRGLGGNPCMWVGGVLFGGEPMHVCMWVGEGGLGWGGQGQVGGG
jgi:hypothetical protein